MHHFLANIYWELSRNILLTFCFQNETRQCCHRRPLQSFLFKKGSYVKRNVLTPAGFASVELSVLWRYCLKIMTPNNYTSSDIWTETGELLCLTPNFSGWKSRILERPRSLVYPSVHCCTHFLGIVWFWLPWVRNRFLFTNRPNSCSAVWL